MPRELIINLSSLSEQPTGLSVYSENVVPFLDVLKPIVLVRASLAEQWQRKLPNGRIEAISNDLSSDSGAKGHIRRLGWTETLLRKRLRKGDTVLFSPVPEAPILSSVRSVVTVHDFTPLRHFSRTSPMYRYCRHYVPRVVRSAQAVLCDSEATANDTVRFCRVDRSKITVTPLACDTDRFRPLGLERRNYFLYVGRYKNYKNIESALEAFALLGDSAMEFWLAGPADPGYEALLAEYRDRRGLAVRFIEYPSADQLPVLLNQAAALVFPSRSEGFGLPILEAMACGTPVITSNVSAMPEAAGDAALLVDPDDIDGLRQAMTLIASDSDVRNDLRTRGLARAGEFSWAATATATTDVIADLLR